MLIDSAERLDDAHQRRAELSHVLLRSPWAVADTRSIRRPEPSSDPRGDASVIVLARTDPVIEAAYIKAGHAKS